MIQEEGWNWTSPRLCRTDQALHIEPSQTRTRLESGSETWRNELWYEHEQVNQLRRDRSALYQAGPGFLLVLPLLTDC